MVAMVVWCGALLDKGSRFHSEVGLLEDGIRTMISWRKEPLNIFSINE